MDNICNFCSKEFSCKISLIRHQKTTKKCLQIQGKEETIECSNCKKLLSITYYNQHKIKCDVIFEKTKKDQEKTKIQNKTLEDKNKLLEKDIQKLKLLNHKQNLELEEYKRKNEILHSINAILKEQNEKLQSSCENITMKLAEKTNTINNINKTVVINTTQLTNEVLRQCAESFSIENAYNINGITQHFTSSLEDHITCSDPSRSVFKYTNDKDEEIVDKDLEILLPQYLSTIKDKNNFFYKEVVDYFRQNNVSFSALTDYNVFYQALKSHIEKTGNKMSEKCKKHIIRVCKKRFLEKNKNKNKKITKELTVEEIMMNVIESGGTVNDFIMNYYGEEYDIEDETEEECKRRRELEDTFIRKKREQYNKV